MLWPMGWRGALRTIGAELRRQERDAGRRARAAEKRFEAGQKLAQSEFAAAEVDVFESRIDELTSMHRECAEQIDWPALRERSLPASPSEPPLIDRRLSEEARDTLESHSRSLLGRIFGTKRREQLQGELVEALESERSSERRTQEKYQRQLAEHARAVEDVLETRELAAQILAGDIDAQCEVIQRSNCLCEVAASLGQTQVEVTLNGRRAALVLRVEQDTVIPTEQKTLTAKGKVSSKKFSAARRMEIYEDYVCGSALRVAREIMAVIPTPAVLIDIESTRVEPSTGHLATSVILSVLVPREATLLVDWAQVDASAFVATLHHRMKVKRGKGFEPVEKLTFADP